MLLPSRSELAAAVAAEGLRPTLAVHAPPALQQLITRCWHLDPSQRPTAEELVSQLAAIRSACAQHAAADSGSHATAVPAAASGDGSTGEQKRTAEPFGADSAGDAEVQQAPWHTQLGSASFTPQVDPACTWMTSQQSAA